MEGEIHLNIENEDVVLDSEEQFPCETDGPSECCVDSADEENEKLKKELNIQKDRLLRTMAEYENFRKRTEREKANIYSDAISMAVSAILPVADSLDCAVESRSGADEEYLKGLEMILSQFKSSMDKLGVESFGAVGDPFSPDIHNAVSHIEDEGMEGNVISQVFQKGYKMADKVIRHAMVQVAN